MGGLAKSNISMTYEIRGSGEVDLIDDEDMTMMFMLLDEMQIRRVNILVKMIDGSAVQTTHISNSQVMNVIVEYNNRDRLDVNNGEHHSVAQDYFWMIDPPRAIP